MAFLKKYNGTTDVRLLRLERLIWMLILVRSRLREDDGKT